MDEKGAKTAVSALFFVQQTLLLLDAANRIGIGPSAAAEG